MATLWPKTASSIGGATSALTTTAMTQKQSLTRVTRPHLKTGAGKRWIKSTTNSPFFRREYFSKWKRFTHPSSFRQETELLGSDQIKCSSIK